MKSVIIGAGTYGEVYASYLAEAGVDLAGFLDDNEALWGRTVRGLPVLGGLERLEALRAEQEVEAVYCPIGTNRVRVRILERARALGFRTPNYLHPSVQVGPDVAIAPEGVYVLAGTVIMPHVAIERDVMISCGSNIIHHTRLAQGTFVSNGVNLGANVQTGPCAYIGMGATVMTGVRTLGADCLIGAGAAVVRDVPDRAVVAGVPARVLRYKE